MGGERLELGGNSLASTTAQTGRRNQRHLDLRTVDISI